MGRSFVHKLAHRLGVAQPRAGRHVCLEFGTGVVARETAAAMPLGEQNLKCDALLVRTRRNAGVQIQSGTGRDSAFRDTVSKEGKLGFQAASNR